MKYGIHRADACSFWVFSSILREVKCLTNAVDCTLCKAVFISSLFPQFLQSSWDWLSPSSAMTPALSSPCGATHILSCVGSTSRRKFSRMTTFELRWTSTKTIWRAAWPSRPLHTSTMATILWRPATHWEQSQRQCTVTSFHLLISVKVSGQVLP